MTDTRTPDDYLNPNWDHEERVHCWRNYISEEIRLWWTTVTPEMRAALARQAEALSDLEEWD